MPCPPGTVQHLGTSKSHQHRGRELWEEAFLACTMSASRWPGSLSLYDLQRLGQQHQPSQGFRWSVATQLTACHPPTLVMKQLLPAETPLPVNFQKGIYRWPKLEKNSWTHSLNAFIYPIDIDWLPVINLPWRWGPGCRKMLTQVGARELLRQRVRRVAVD